MLISSEKLYTGSILQKDKMQFSKKKNYIEHIEWNQPCARKIYCMIIKAEKPGYKKKSCLK